MKAGVYYRISTRDKQDIGMQQKAVRDYCEREGIEIVKEYQDIGVSGKKESRPEFDKLLEDMRSKKFDCVVCYKLDRIGRSLSHLVKLFEEFKKKNVQFISTTQNFDTTSSSGRLQLGMMMLLAQYERELIVERVQSGVDKIKEQIKEKGFAITKQEKKITKLGRPLGRKDKKRRRRAGYIARYLNKKTIP